MTNKTNSLKSASNTLSFLKKNWKALPYVLFIINEIKLMK